MRVVNMKLNRLIILLSILVACASALCNTEQKELNFITKEQPDTVIDVKENCVKIVGLTQNSLDRFTSLNVSFIIEDFTVDDVNTLNQPNLFGHHTSLTELRFRIYNGNEELVVHENLLGGLENLEVLALVGLNLETIPKLLFSNLFKIRTINLSNNKLQSLDSTVFSTNPKLSYTHLGENQFLQSGIPLDLTLLHDRASISLLGSYVNDFRPLLPIFLNPNITYLNLAMCNLTNIKISDFAQIPDRQNGMVVRLYDADYTFHMTDLQENDIEYQIIRATEIRKILNGTRAYIDGNIGEDSAMCNDCRFIKEAFKAHIENENFNFYLTKSKVIFSFDLGCNDMVNHYTIEFKRNCPDACTCQYNPFFDKVWIDCHNRNLTTVPTIEYPSQFEKIISISLDLSKNLLESFVLDNIHHRVLENIAELYLNENQLKSLNVEESDKLKLRRINLCRNPIWSETVEGVSIFLNGILGNVSTETCMVGDEYPPALYITDKTDMELNIILENAVCH